MFSFTYKVPSINPMMDPLKFKGIGGTFFRSCKDGSKDFDFDFKKERGGGNSFDTKILRIWPVELCIFCGLPKKELHLIVLRRSNGPIHDPNIVFFYCQVCTRQTSY